jgi:predicted permease
MAEIYLRILPFLITFTVGFTARRLKVLNSDHCKQILKLTFYIFTPCLILKTIPTIDLSAKQFTLPAAAAIILFTEFILATLIFRKISRSRKTRGAMVLAASIMNTGFIMPFVFEFAGDSGLSQLFLFDLGNTVLVLTFLFFISSQYGKQNISSSFKSLVTSPPLWALIIGYLINISNFTIPEYIYSSLDFISQATFPLILVALGGLLEFDLTRFKYAIGPIVLRMGLGLVLGIILIIVFRFTGTYRLVVILAASSPCGFNSVIFSSLHNLDARTAATAVSVSLILSMILLPFVLNYAG